jgi:replicative DNA helicase
LKSTTISSKTFKKRIPYSGTNQKSLLGTVLLGSGTGQPATSCVCTEMPPIEYLHRSAARRTDTYIGKFRDGTLHPDQWEHYVERAVHALSPLLYLDGTRVRVRLEDIQEHFEAIQEMFYAARSDHKQGDRKHGLILVDSVSAWARSMEDNFSENDRVSEALRSLQQLAETLRISIIAIGEQNRLNRNSDSQMAGKGSSVWEYGVWSQMNLEKVGKADDCGNREILLTLSKNRRGREGCKIPLWFEGGFMRFTELDKSEVDADQADQKAVNGFSLGPGKKHQPTNGKSAA